MSVRQTILASALRPGDAFTRTREGAEPDPVFLVKQIKVDHSGVCEVTAEEPDTRRTSMLFEPGAYVLAGYTSRRAKAQRGKYYRRLKASKGPFG